LTSRVAIVAAMAREIRPLVRSWKREPSQSGIAVFSSPYAVAVFAGMGRRRAELAAQAALEFTPVHQFISAGWAGGLHAGLAPGAVKFAECVIDAATGEKFVGAPADAPGESAAVLVTSDHVVSPEEKRGLRAAYAADIVDMEAATVARIARAEGVPFVAIKGVSDAHDFDLPGMENFATEEGQFREGAFAIHAAFRPGLWKPVHWMARNSGLAARNLCAELERYLAGGEKRTKAGNKA
jgi:adenosylhomocysteine nucleosidase